jgi:hypothetical protein
VPSPVSSIYLANVDSEIRIYSHWALDIPISSNRRLHWLSIRDSTVTKFYRRNWYAEFAYTGQFPPARRYALNRHKGVLISDLAMLKDEFASMCWLHTLISLDWMMIRTEMHSKQKQPRIGRRYGSTTEGISRIVIKVV